MSEALDIDYYQKGGEVQPKDGGETTAWEASFGQFGPVFELTAKELLAVERGGRKSIDLIFNKIEGWMEIIQDDNDQKLKLILSIIGSIYSARVLYQFYERWPSPIHKLISTQRISPSLCADLAWTVARNKSYEEGSLILYLALRHYPSDHQLLRTLLVFCIRSRIILDFMLMVIQNFLNHPDSGEASFLLAAKAYAHCGHPEEAKTLLGALYAGPSEDQCIMRATERFRSRLNAT